MGKDDSLVGGVLLENQIVIVQDGRYFGGELYLMLFIVDSDFICYGKKRRE